MDVPFPVPPSCAHWMTFQGLSSVEIEVQYKDPPNLRLATMFAMQICVGLVFIFIVNQKGLIALRFPERPSLDICFAININKIKH